MIKKLCVVIMLLMVASLSIAGCTSSTSSNQTATGTPPASTTPTPTGKQIVVAPGQQFSITLHSNQTTGYAWLPTFNTSAIVQKTGSGSAGTEVFTFEALRTGTTLITFDYVRTSERGTLNERSYIVVVR